jgi:hypothetical protein
MKGGACSRSWNELIVATGDPTGLMLEGFNEVIEIEISPYLKFSMYPVGRE